MPVKATPRSSGRQTVSYRHTNGRTFDAVVEGAGAGGTLNLFVPHLPRGQRHKVNVPKATTMKQTGVWLA